MPYAMAVRDRRNALSAVAVRGWVCEQGLLQVPSNGSVPTTRTIVPARSSLVISSIRRKNFNNSKDGIRDMWASTWLWIITDFRS